MVRRSAVYALIKNWIQGCDWLSGHGIWAIILPEKWRPLNSLLVFLANQDQQDLAILQIAFNKTIIPLVLVQYEMTTANSALRASLAIYHLICNVRSWNNCEIFALVWCIISLCLVTASLSQEEENTKGKGTRQTHVCWRTSCSLSG